MKTLRFWMLPALLALSFTAGATDLSRAVVLVAKPALQDPLYGSSVLIVAPLGDAQHVGFIVNRPTRVHLGELFPEHAAAVKRSQEIADGCDIQLDFKKRHFPVYVPPEGKTPVNGPVAPGVTDDTPLPNGVEAVFDHAAHGARSIRDTSHPHSAIGPLVFTKTASNCCSTCS